MSNNLIPSTSAGGFSTAGNVVAGNISATANITAANFATSGNGGNITGANVVSANTFAMFQNSTITEVASPVPGNYAIALSSTGTVSDDQQLLVYPTSIDANHLHLSTGNLANTELFLGNDNVYVKLANTGNIVVNSNNSAGNTAQWTFDTAGTLTLPGEGVVRSNDDTIILQSYDVANTTGYGLRIGTSGQLFLEQGTNPAWLSFVANTSNAEITAASGTSGGAGKNLTITAGAADQSDFYATAGGNVNITGGLGAFNDGGGGGPGGSINLTAGASADPAGVSGNITINSSTSTWTFDNFGNLSAPGNITANTFISNAFNVVTAGNLSISSQYGLGTVGTILEQDGLLELVGNGAGGCVVVGWNSDYGNLGNVARIWFNQPGSSGNAILTTGDLGNTSYSWNFDAAGNLTLPGNTFAVNYANGNPVIIGGTPTIIANGLSNVSIPTANGTITFGVNGYSYGNIGSGVAIGYLAGNSGFQTSGIAIGTSAGTSNQGLHGIAMGWNTGMFTQGNSTVAIGENAAYTNQGNFAIAVGAVAGREGQSANAIAIGTRAGYVSQGARAVAIGRDAGNTSQGADSIAIGTTAGLDTQGTNSVAIGVYAGNISQGSSSVAIGGEAGQSSQGVNSVAIGVAAGANAQGVAATALGWNAGQTTQGNLAVAVGSGAAYNNQGYAAIAIGADTSPINQGQYSIAIGAGASTGNIQANNSIIIDATGTGTTPASNAGFYVAPVRNDTGNTTNVVYYNTTSKEVTYGSAGNVTFLANSAATFKLASSGELLVASNGTPANYVVNSTTPDIDLRNASGTGSYTQGATQYVMRVAGSNNLILDNTGLLSAPGAISAVGNVRGSNVNTAGIVVTTPTAYANLTATAGGRAFINDGNLVAAGGGSFGAQVSGGGANICPVWSDGTNWYLG